VTQGKVTVSAPEHGYYVPGTWAYRWMLARQQLSDLAWWLLQLARLMLIASLVVLAVIATGYFLALGGSLR
jgi:hypothetical protein